MIDHNAGEYYTKQKHRFYAIPLELAYEASCYAASIDDTCIEGLRRKIREKKQRLYGTTCLEDKQVPR